MRKVLLAVLALAAIVYFVQQDGPTTQPTSISDDSDDSSGDASLPAGAPKVPAVASTAQRATPDKQAPTAPTPEAPATADDHDSMSSTSTTTPSDPAQQSDAAPPTDPPVGADEDELAAGSAGDDHEHPQTSMERSAFPPDNGSVPASPEGLVAYSSISIVGDDQLVPSKGVRYGSGTLEDPFVITGNYVSGRISVLDTDACIVVKENYFDGQLALNWNGQCIYVHHNYIRDLRVNENVARTGYATGGLIEENRMNVVGQLRHYDGEFRGNVVGPRRDVDLLTPIVSETPFLLGTDTRVLNFDGFNQGLVHHNTFYGSVDLDFHGHHHGTGFYAPHSHYHGADPFRLTMRSSEDHTMRWTSVSFTDNRIEDPTGYGLRYNDDAHQADDVTATSETPNALKLPHRHFTNIVIARNIIAGAPLWIDVFNADSANHTGRNPGTLDIVGNTVKLADPAGVVDLCAKRFGPDYDPWTAIRIVRIKEVAMNVVGNQVQYEPRQVGPGADPVPSALDLARTCPIDPPPELTGIAFIGVRDSTLDISGNAGRGFYYGVRAQQVDNRTAWRVVDNDFADATHPLWYDTTVRSRPETQA